jgi:hypothetical protein
MFVCCECCVLSSRGLCDELITRPEESYRLCCIVVCDLETSRIRRPWPALGRSATEKKLIITINWVVLDYIPYFSIGNAHLMYNAHAILFRHSFWCIDNARDAN